MFSGKSGFNWARWFYSDKSGSIWAKVIEFGQSGCMLVKVVIGQNGCIRVKSGCIRAKQVVFLQKWLYSGKRGCIRARWLYLGKVQQLPQQLGCRCGPTANVKSIKATWDEGPDQALQGKRVSSRNYAAYAT